jgi:membrane-associated phospholipid phosphatase
MFSMLTEIDRIIFEFINGTLIHPILDWTMPLITQPTTWIPLYVGMIIWFIYRFRRLFFIPLLGVLMAFATGDLVSARLIKPGVKRTRPCNEITVNARVIGVTCRPSYSFPSSHAVNHMAIAIFIIVLIGIQKKIWVILCLFWAVMISYSRVYLGLHYPGDVIAGMIMGGLIGLFFANIATRLLNKYPT